MSLIYSGACCQIGAMEINKGLLGKTEEKEGAWADAKKSFCKTDKAKSGALPLTAGDGLILFNHLLANP